MLKDVAKTGPEQPKQCHLSPRYMARLHFVIRPCDLNSGQQNVDRSDVSLFQVWPVFCMILSHRLPSSWMQKSSEELPTPRQWWSPGERAWTSEWLHGTEPPPTLCWETCNRLWCDWEISLYYVKKKKKKKESIELPIIWQTRFWA